MAGEIDIPTLLGDALVRKLKTSPAGIDSMAVASSLGNTGSGSPLGVTDTSQLFGLGPEDISSIAKNRATISYQNMLSNIGALNFADKLKGVSEDRQLNSDMVKQEQHGEILKQLANIEGAWRVKAANIQKDAGHDPIKLKKLEVANRMMSKDATIRDSVTPQEREFALDLFGPKDITPADAGKYLSTYYLYKSAMPEIAAQMEPYVSLYQGVLDRASKSALKGTKSVETATPAPAKAAAKETYTNPNGVTFEFQGGDRDDIKNWKQVTK